jgi:hypothetical protein
MLSHRGQALHVVESPGEKWYVERRIKRLDPRLFVEKQIDLDQQPVWTVQLEGQLGEPIQTIYEHRAGDGSPIAELSERVIDEVQRIMASPLNVKAIIEHNEALKLRRRQERQEQVAEMVHDRAKFLRSRHYGIGTVGTINHARHRRREADLNADRGL